MLKSFFAKNRRSQDEDIVKAIVTQTSAMINDLHHQIDLRFKELSSQVKEIEIGLVQLETNLLTKDLKDKQAYGLLHYKLHEVKHQKLNEEIKELEAALVVQKLPNNDQ